MAEISHSDSLLVRKKTHSHTLWHKSEARVFGADVVGARRSQLLGIAAGMNEVGTRRVYLLLPVTHF